MVNVGSTVPPYTSVSGVNAKVTLNGNVYVLATTYYFEFGYNLEQEKVAGTSTPIINTAEFQGTGEMEILYSTENTNANEQFSALLVPVQGAIQAINFEIDATDPQGNQRKFKWTGQLFPQKARLTVQGPSWVKYKLTYLFNAAPALS